MKALRRAALLALACCLTATLQGCATSFGSASQTAELPDMPGYVAPVSVPAVRGGQDARKLAGQLLVALDDANGRITSGVTWYRCIQGDFHAGKATCAVKPTLRKRANLK